MLLPHRRDEAAISAVLPAWLRGLRRGLDLAAAALLVVAIVALTLVLVLMNVEILSRTFLGVSTLISDEYAGYGFALTIMAGLTHAHRSEALLRVDFGVDRMPRRVRLASLGLASAVGLVATGFAAYVGYKTWALSWLFDSASAFASSTPLWLPQAVIPIGFALLALSFAEDALSRLLQAVREA